MILISYETFVNHVLGLYTHGKRPLIGKFKESNNAKIITEQLECLNIEDNAKKSYKAVIAYFNHTRKRNESIRIMVFAKWALREKDVSSGNTEKTKVSTLHKQEPSGLHTPSAKSQRIESDKTGHPVLVNMKEGDE